MLNVSNQYHGVNQAGRDQNPNGPSLEQKLESIFALLKSAVIDVAAFKKQLSEYSSCAIANRVDCQPAYEAILKELAFRLSRTAYGFCARFSSKEAAAPHQLDSIYEVIEAVRRWQGTQIGSDLTTQMIALRHLDVEIPIQVALHAQVIADIQQLKVDTGLRESVAKRNELNSRCIQVAQKLENLSGIWAVPA